MFFVHAKQDADDQRLARPSGRFLNMRPATILQDRHTASRRRGRSRCRQRTAAAAFARRSVYRGRFGPPRRPSSQRVLRNLNGCVQRAERRARQGRAERQGVARCAPRALVHWVGYHLGHGFPRAAARH